MSLANVIELDMYKEVRRSKVAKDKPRTFTDMEKKEIQKDMQKGYMKMLANFYS